MVNNGDYMPTDSCDPTNPPTPAEPTCRNFNSYNQPSVSADQLVVMRARSEGADGGAGESVGAVDDGEGGNQPVHGVFTRDMAAAGPVVRILDRDTLVPQPDNLGETFIEPPSFPRIDIWSDTMATRGNHKPVWTYVLRRHRDQSGTAGIYTNPFADLITGASKLGAVPDFSFFQVPEAPGIPFDVFPGAPAVADGATIAFKGNYTVAGAGKTGVYYRNLVDVAIPSSEGSLAPAGGTNPVVLIANNTTPSSPAQESCSAPRPLPAPPLPLRTRGRRGSRWRYSPASTTRKPDGGGIYVAPLAPTTRFNSNQVSRRSSQSEGRSPGE